MPIHDSHLEGEKTTTWGALRFVSAATAGMAYLLHNLENVSAQMSPEAISLLVTAFIILSIFSGLYSLHGALQEEILRVKRWSKSE